MNGMLSSANCCAQHAVAAVGRNDAEPDRAVSRHRVQVRMRHCARVEGGDLVVVEVGGDERLRGVAAADMPHVAAVDAERVEPRHVRLRIVAHGGHRQRRAAQQLQVVGDVAGAAAELAPQFGHQEGHVQDVHLVGQDVVLEAPVEHHDRVVGDRAADQRCSHRRRGARPPSVRGRRGRRRSRWHSARAPRTRCAPPGRCRRRGPRRCGSTARRRRPGNRPARTPCAPVCGSGCR